MIGFLAGFVCGIAFVIAVAYVFFFNVFGKPSAPPPFTDQFQPVTLPPELRNFLRSNPDGGSQWESCFSLSALLHFLYREHKDTRKFRRWVYKRLQLELNDLTTRAAAGRIIQSIQIRDLCVGTQFPIINNIRVESCKMGEDRETFEELALIVDVDYKGGFQTSVDVTMVLGRFAHLSIKVLRLSGKARVVMTRQPYVHWAFAFVDMPVLDFKIDSQFQGRDLKHAIPLITQAFRKALQRKHVWPNYKIRYRPLFPNPILQPSPPISAFDHIKVTGTGLEVTVLECSRLNTKLAPSEQVELFCTVSLDQRPFMHNAQPGSSHCISVMLSFTRHGTTDPLGLEFTKSSSELGLRAVKVSSVEPDSLAEKSGFRDGDILIAINNVPIRNQLQATRILTGTVGELLVLVERSLSQYIDDDSSTEELVVSSGGDSKEDFVCIGAKKPKTVSLDVEPSSDSMKRAHSDTDFLQSTIRRNTASPTDPISIHSELAPADVPLSGHCGRVYVDAQTSIAHFDHTSVLLFEK